MVDYLASVTDLKVFGCTIDFLQADTQIYLDNPVWEKLQQSTEYSIVFRDCCEVLPTKERFEESPFRDIPLAVHVPMNPEEKVPEGAFGAVPRLRHVSVESGIRVVGAEAWQCCRQLRIVKMPVTVVCIADNAFRGCQLLNSVTAPGCVEFGYKAFAECSSLQWVYAAEGVANQFCSATKFGHYLSRDCMNLAAFALREAAHPHELPVRPNARELAQGCLGSTGIRTLELTRDFQVLGAHACDNCQLLKKVDISNTKIEEIQEFTFVHCTSLCEVSLPTTLHTIRVKAFMNCAALPELWAALHSEGWSSSQAGRNGLCHLSSYEMATVATHDSRHRACVRISVKYISHILQMSSLG